MQSILGLDIAKSVFHVDGGDATGQLVLRQQLKRQHVLAASFLILGLVLVLT
jgi:hypothetical protein